MTNSTEQFQTEIQPHVNLIISEKTDVAPIFPLLDATIASRTTSRL
jgi:hypothetical protein